MFTDQLFVNLQRMGGNGESVAIQISVYLSYVSVPSL